MQNRETVPVSRLLRALRLSIKICLNLLTVSAVSFPSEMTSHDIRLKVPAKKSLQRKMARPRKRERGRDKGDGRKVRGGQHRYLVSLLLHLLLLLLFLSSPSLLSFFPCDLLQAFSDKLTPRDLVPWRKSPPLRRTATEEARIKDLFRGHRARRDGTYFTFYSLLAVFIFNSKRDFERHPCGADVKTKSSLICVRARP